MCALGDVVLSGSRSIIPLFVESGGDPSAVRTKRLHVLPQEVWLAGSIHSPLGTPTTVNFGVCGGPTVSRAQALCFRVISGLS